MTDEEVNYQAMARQSVQKLTDYRNTWEPAAPRLLPDHERVVQLLGDFATIGAQVAGTGSECYPDAKDRAEDEAVVAAMRLVAGGRGPHDAGGAAAGK